METKAISRIDKARPVKLKSNGADLAIQLLVIVLLMPKPVAAQNFKPLRYNEDYTYLKNDSSQKRISDKIKFIALDSRRDIYVSIGGEIRWQYNFFRNEDWGELPADRKGFLLMRHMLHADIKVKDHIRLFTQLGANFETGRAFGPRFPTDQDQISLHQLFIDLMIKLGDNESILLRAGRQELLYGSQRLVAVREGPNNRQSFDAAKIIFRKKTFRQMLFLRIL